MTVQQAIILISGGAAGSSVTILMLSFARFVRMNRAIQRDWQAVLDRIQEELAASALELSSRLRDLQVNKGWQVYSREDKTNDADDSEEARYW